MSIQWRVRCRATTCLREPAATLADGVRVKQPGMLTQRILAELLDDVVIVREAELRETLVRLALEEHVIAEGAGALALAAGKRVAGKRKCAVVSGGNLDAAVLARLLSDVRPRATAAATPAHARGARARRATGRWPACAAGSPAAGHVATATSPTDGPCTAQVARKARDRRGTSRMSHAQQHPTRIRIFDTTLRDGEQSPGFTMSAQQKIAFAHALAELGVDVIEAGFPNSSPADFGAVQTDRARRARRIDRARSRAAIPADIEACARALEGAAAPRIHAFISTSPLHRQHKLRMSREQVHRARRAWASSSRAATWTTWSSPPRMRSAPSATSWSRSFDAAVAAGARTINVPDTVGYATPAEIRALFECLRANVKGADGVVFSAHCHNDLGLAVANSLAAIEGGARQVECTINGIGERAGNAALEELVMALKVRGGWYAADTRIDTPQAAGDLAPAVAHHRHARSSATRRSSALNAFAHESGIHQHGMLKHRDTYEIMRPEDVGWPDSQLVLGRHSGRAAVADRLRQLGYVLEDEATGPGHRRCQGADPDPARGHRPRPAAAGRGRTPRRPAGACPR